MNVLQVWLAQNRYWLRSVVTMAIIAIIIVFTVSEVGFSVVTFWSNTLALKQSDPLSLNSRLTAERALNQVLSASIDSLELNLRSSARPGEILQFLRAQVVESGLTLASFDQQESAEVGAKSIRLIVEGQYFALGNLITAVEKTPSMAKIVELDLIEHDRGNGILSAAVTLRSAPE